MANYANLKSDIAGVIRTNNNEEITGDILQEQLLGMVDSLGAGFQYKGVATPTTAPGTPDENVFYIASTAGTYTNFGGLAVAEGEVAILKYNGSWAKEVTGAATAAQVTQLREEVVHKSQTELSTPFTENGYYMSLYSAVIGSEYTFSKIAAQNYAYWNIAVHAGDVFTLTTSSNTSSAKAYAILDANNVVLALQDNAVVNEIITIPAQGATLIVNSRVAQGDVFSVLAEVGVLTMDGYKYGGVATKDGSPGVLAQDKFFIAYEPGIYTNYGGLEVLDSEVARLVFDRLSGWRKETELNGFSEVVPYVGGYANFTGITEGGTYDDRLYNNPSWACADECCLEGDLFIITTSRNTASAPALVFLDESNKVIMLHQSAVSNYLVSAPQGAARVIINSLAASYKAQRVYRRFDSVVRLTNNLYNFLKSSVVFESNYYCLLRNVSVGEGYTFSKVSDNNRKWAMETCQEGDIFYLKIAGNTSSAKAYAILDANNVVLAYRELVPAEEYVVIPQDGAYIIINSLKSEDYYVLRFGESIRKSAAAAKRIKRIDALPVPIVNGAYMSLNNVTIGDKFKPRITSFPSFSYVFMQVRSGDIISFETSGNTSSAKAYAVLDTEFNIVDIQQRSGSYSLVISSNGYIVVNSVTSAFYVSLLNGLDTRVKSGDFFSVFSKNYDIGKYNNEASFDRATIGSLYAGGIRLGYERSLPQKGAYINTDVELSYGLDASTTIEDGQKRSVPYLYWNGEKVGTIVLYDSTTGNPYILDKNGNKVMLKTE